MIVLLYVTLIAAALGVLLAWGMAVESWHDLRALRRAGLRNGVETMFVSRYRQAKFGFVYSVLLTFKATMIAMIITPTVARRPSGLRWEVYAVLAGMLASALLLATDGWMARREIRRAETRIAGTLFDDEEDGAQDGHG